MTVEQLEKGRELLDQLNTWKVRYKLWKNGSLLRITIERNNCADISFSGSGDDLSIRFFNEVELKYGDLCQKQIELLTKQIESL